MGEAAAFLAVALVVICTPGPDTALTVRNALGGGRRAGVLTACGVVSGQLVWTLAASAGVAALLVASEPAFRALKLVGAAYLVWLGMQTLLAAATGRSRQERVRERRPRASYRQGLLSNLANPKAAVFFTSLLPQFAATFLGLVALGVVFAALTLLWLSLYSVVVGWAGDLLRLDRVRRVLDAITGAFLAAFGIRLATDR